MKTMMMGSDSAENRGMAQQNKPPEEEARVGIFWLYNGQLIIDSTPLSQAEPGTC